MAKVFDKSKILGIDSDDALITYAEQAFVPYNVQYAQYNALQINTINKEFDFIIAKSALHLIHQEYIFNEYMDILKSNGTFYAIERTDISVDSFHIFDDVKEKWKQQYNKQRKVDCLFHYLNQENYKIETFKFGQKVSIESEQYKQGILNKEMSCLWDFDDQYIITWLKNNMKYKKLVNVFEEYDIIAITKLK